MGGVPVNELVRSLLDSGHKVSLFTGSRGIGAVWRASGVNLSIVSVPYRERARARALDFFRHERRALARELQSCDADVFHAHWTYEFALACIDARANPLLVTAHDAPLTILRYMPDPYRLIRTLMAYRARMSIKSLTAVSPYLARQWRKQMCFASPIRVIPNPTPTIRIPPVERSRHPVVLDIGDAGRRKNIRALLIGFAIVRAKRNTSELRLIGPGLESDSEIANWSKSKGLDGGVAFLGQLDRVAVARQLAEATIFCHASLEESQPMCLLEAMSASLPIVAGRVAGGVPWTLFDGEAGKLVDVSRPEAIALGLESLLSDEIGSGRLAAKAFELMPGRYAPALVSSMYVTEYERLIDQANRQPS